MKRKPYSRPACTFIATTDGLAALERGIRDYGAPSPRAMFEAMQDLRDEADERRAQERPECRERED